MSETENTATVTVAVLDDNDVFLGVEAIPESEADGRVIVSADIDLKVGAYKWQAGEARFMPIEGQIPSAEKALYDLAKALIDGGIVPVVPASLTNWMTTTAKKRGW
ncbi:hypothetical protein [uncultured Thalassospira sp.]|uniref:hypothetical protein n=1 Tax=uncultured Thalassospira sp. TaxID=404382 RepID=UPI0030DBDE73|tara:strand:+ start:41019 stop:41336 length:318 start_codon:yes stop_codon:yes gene_type:complete